MQFPTDLLAVFGKHSGSLQPDDALLEVPRALLPVVSIPERLGRTERGSTTPLQSSFHTSVEDTIANGSVDANIAEIVPGIWEFWLEASFIADYTDLTERNVVYAGLGSQAVSFPQFATFWSFVNTVQRSFFHWRIAHVDPLNYFVSRELTANGVGETKRFSAILIGNRLG